MKYFAEIYPTTARPTGQIASEKGINTENHVFMARWEYLGNFEDYDAAREYYEGEICRDAEGFTQWKKIK